MTCERYCRTWFSRSLRSKRLLSLWDIFSMVTELRWFFNGRLHPPANHVSQVTLTDIQSAWTERVSGSCNYQLPICAADSWAAAWLPAGVGDLENLLKAKVSVNSNQFYEVKLESYLKFIRYSAFLLLLLFI